MRVKTINAYTAQELKEKFPAAFEKAHREFTESQDEILWQDETVGSLLKLIKQAGYKVKDYSLGAYNRGNCLRLEERPCDELSGKRAFSWLENEVLKGLRIRYKSPERWKQSKYGNRAGTVPDCPLTGYFADEVYLKALKENLRSGMSVKESLEDLESTCAKILEDELDAQNSEEYFLETSEANEYEYDERGDLV